jgi:hypothetical protein
MRLWIGMIAAVLPAVAFAANPTSNSASNINPGDTSSTIAPQLPTPASGEDNAPTEYLIAARQALAAGRTGEAQEALERAETRLADRSTPLFRTNEAARGPVIDESAAGPRGAGLRGSHAGHGAYRAGAGDAAATLIGLNRSRRIQWRTPVKTLG